MKTKHHKTLYGKIVKKDLLDGICTGCRGEKDKDTKKNKSTINGSKSNNKGCNNEEDVILCDGHGCCREYHLSCTDPLLHEIPEGEFYCPDCDPLGTTKLLEEYFDSVAELKAEASSSREFVESLIGEHMQAERGGNPFDSPDGGSSPSTISSFLLPTDITTTTTNLIRVQEPSNNFQGNGQGKEGGSTKKRKHGKMNDEKDAPPMSEICRMAALYPAAMDDSKWRNEGDQPAPEEETNREFLIGKICKVYCTKDNEYHTGRIIDWRSAIEPGVDPKVAETLFYGKGSIGCTEFLVRFAAGADGRKKTLLQWLILEEHSAAISASLVMAMRDKGRGMNGWRPGQLMLRTCIELIPVRNMMSKTDQYGLVTFFDLDMSIYLDLYAEAVSFVSETFNREFKKKLSLTPSKKPKNFHVANHLIEVFLGSADIEIQEQMRTKSWYGLHLKNLYHKRALTLPDEYSRELYFETPRVLQEKKDAEGRQMPIIKFCPTIQRGLDKQWIASRLMNVSDEKSLDAMASMKVASLSRPVSVAMALMNAQHSRRNKL